MKMRHIAETYDPAADFRYYRKDPELTYMLACLPRTGSTHLALSLWRTGLLGAPMEYLNLPHPSGIFERLGGGDPLTYWRELKRRRTSPNGVFGFKMFLSCYSRVAHLYPSLLPLIRSDKVVYLNRRDKVAQAVSQAKASQSNTWFSAVESEPEPVCYDFEFINQFYQVALRHHEGWDCLFKLSGADPIEVDYEDLAEDTNGTIDFISRRLGVSLESRSELDSLLEIERQSDCINEEWKENFVRDLRRVG